MTKRETVARSRGILFKGPLVRAILEGRKTQTRRIVKLTGPKCASDCTGVEPARAFRDPGFGDGEYMHLPCKDGAAQRVRCPYGDVGDELWVRETWCAGEAALPSGLGIIPASHVRANEPLSKIVYRATSNYGGDQPPWRPSIHMPRWASRITLRITDVRVQRLQEISEDDARAEGVGPLRSDGRMLNGFPALDGFADGWESIHGLGAWERNDWVWAITFERLNP